MAWQGRARHGGVLVGVVVAAQSSATKPNEATCLHLVVVAAAPGVLGEYRPWRDIGVVARSGGRVLRDQRHASARRLKHV
jgi:hypothetical protein